MDTTITQGLVIISLLITLGAQFFVNMAYKKYAKVKNKKKITGAQAATKILAQHKLTNLKLTQIKGQLSDYYDSSKKLIALSSDIYAGDSVAAVAIAAHECGHAIQDQEKMTILRWRNALIPVINFASYAGYLAIVIGLLFSNALFLLGIFFEITILLFQLITLPIEINASQRALAELEQLQLLGADELPKGKTVLTAAACTYVAGVAAALLQILRLLLIFRNRDN